MRKVVFPLVIAALLPAACQTTKQQTVELASQQVEFREPVANTKDYQTFCPDYALDVAREFFKQPKVLSGYLATGAYFKSRSESSVDVRGEQIVHQAAGIAAVYFFEEGTHKGRTGTFILAKGFFDQSNSGRWEPMIAVDPRRVDQERCYTLND